MVKNTCKQEKKTQLQQMGFVQSHVIRETKQKQKKQNYSSYSPIQNMQHEIAASNER